MSKRTTEKVGHGSDSDLDRLADMPIFGGVAASALAFLLARAERVQVPVRGAYFHEGEPGSSMYVLRSGSVEVFRSRHGYRDVLGRLGPGDCFGEMAMLDLYPRSATVQAVEDSSALAISHGLLFELYGQSPEPFTIMMMNLARELSRRLREADDRLAAAPGRWSAVRPSDGRGPGLPYI